MGKKRKSRPSAGSSASNVREETFDDSEDEFYKNRDQILLDETPAAKRRRKIEEQDERLQHSDEEVFPDNIPGQDSPEESQSTEDENDAVGVDSDEEDERIWGTSKKDYYNADTIETEQDALEEEAEARRLQEKQLRSMREEDFGFNEAEWVDTQPASTTKRSVVEKLPPVQIPDNATDEERMSILTNRYPEFVPLAEDLLNLQETHETLKQAVQNQMSNSSRGDMQSTTSVSLTKLRAVSAYMAAIAMYIAILSSTKDGFALPPAEIREHTIMNSLLRCRQLWEDVKDMEEIEERSSDREADAHQPALSDASKPPVRLKERQSPKAVQSTSQQDDPTHKNPQKRKQRDAVNSKPERLQGTEKVKPKKRRDLKDLVSQAVLANGAEQDSDFGDEEPLTHEEAAEKARKKKSLRFYTSMISQKSAKRGAAAREAGGDDDLPYKERIRDKQERLMREAEQRAHKENRIDANNDGEDDDLACEINDEANNYYNKVALKTRQKKADKQARAEAYAQAAREGAQVFEEEQIGADGKRKISYAIEKNKGLTPKRKKDVRNPRVKKKKRYEQKVKKLNSIRPVFKGGEGKGGYGGELTGIKTNLVKGIRL